jgi:PIN domain nuclease of toxin-antitoxin system
MTFVLDTHILIWWVGGDRRLNKKQTTALASATPDDPLLVSDITLWEVAMLQSLGRIRLTLPIRSWLEHAVAPPIVRRCHITPAIAAQVAALPASFHRDPADRIILSTAIIHGASLITCDQQMLAANLVPTI